MAMSHTNCDHERTPKARAACRSRQREFDATMTTIREVTPTRVNGLSKVTDGAGNPVDWQVTPALVAKVQAKIAKRSRRTDPTLRVAPRRTGRCVQAALHVGGGRCACGWEGKGCECGNPLVNVRITGPNAGGMCGPSYCHYALAN